MIRLIAAVAALAALVVGLNVDDVEDQLARLSAALNGDTTHAPAPAKLRSLPVAQLHDDGTYDRAAFGEGWADLDGDGCSTREEIMARDLVDIRIPDGCDVDAGTLNDPYTGRTIHYTDADGMAVQIDHVYSLHEAWMAGADHWSEARRVRFANDPRNLLAVDGPANESKGDAGPAEWAQSPRFTNKDGYGCTYAHKYIDVVAAYHLRITPADKRGLRDLLDTCPPTRK